MIERYTKPEMGHLWSIENEWQQILNVEMAACDAMAELGEIPKEAAKNIRAKAKFDVNRIHEIESVTHHDIIAFLTNVAENVGDDSKYIHKGLTSSDVKDTAYCMMMRDACTIILDDLKKFREVLRRRAKEFKHTPCIGRTHGIHAEPMTFGLKLLLWSAEIERDIERMEHAKKIVSVCKLSGAVGTYSNIDPKIEQMVGKKLGLTPVRLATQVIQRDRHAEFVTSIAICSSTLEKIATEVRNLQRTDIREAEEYFSPGQKGSSAMPHKRNPINCEKVCGLSRVLRGYALAAMEDVALWHERDISHSSVERIILPDATELLDYMLVLMTRILGDLFVYPENMLRSMSMSYGLPNSQHVLLTLIDKGMLRETAYDCVQRCAMRAWQEQKPFRQMLEQDETVTSHLSPAELDECFELSYHYKHVDEVFKRLGLEK